MRTHCQTGSPVSVSNDDSTTATIAGTMARNPHFMKKPMLDFQDGRPRKRIVSPAISSIA